MFGDENPDKKKWPFIKLEDVAAKTKNSMRTGPFGSDLLHSEFVEAGVFVLGIDNVVNNRFEWSKSRFITEEKYQKLKRYTVFPGDMLISIMGTIGRVAIVPHDMPPAINSKHLAAITLNREQCNPSFVSFLLQASPDIIKQLAIKGRGAIMNGLNLGIIKELKFHLPTLPLQTRFAAIMANIECQKEIVRQQQAESEALFGRLLQEAFEN